MLLSKIVENPLETPPWVSCFPITTEEVLNVSANDRIDPASVNRGDFQSREDHIRRIAFLVFNIDKRPITLLQSFSTSWSVKDGNHRLAAAIVRQDRSIRVNII